MTISKNNKMMAHLNYKMKVIVQDSRTFVGYFKAFDKHMNIILADCEELRRVKPKPGKKTSTEEEKRVLGLVLLRGDKIISISVEGPPQKEDSSAQLPKAGGLGGPGMAKSAGRGMPMVPQMGAAPGLQGAVRGVGGPGMAAMQPGYGAPMPGGRPPY
uniref:Sm protein B n=1 Tax=Acrobeloides nanus TaxID=290746 RepID=A0A914D307_9BILA